MSNKVEIIMIIIGACFLLKELFISSRRGKHIIKPDERRNLAIMWVIFLIFWSLFLIGDFKGYAEYTNPFYGKYIEDFTAFYRNRIIQHIFWIEICILNIIGTMRFSQITEKGIYYYLHFFKWSKVQSYTWVSSNIIQFKVSLFHKINWKIRFTIEEDKKFKMEEVLKGHITA